MDCYCIDLVRSSFPLTADVWIMNVRILHHNKRYYESSIGPKLLVGVVG